MADNSYAQLIDDFEKGINVLKGETLTEYIKRMGGVDYESKADGGAIGIEVLFTDKKAKGGRVGFQSGGSGNWWDGLTGEAKGIYDSMTAYGASDAEIQAKLQAQNLWSPDGSGGGGGGGTDQVTGIINQNIGGDGPYPGQVVDQTSFADYKFNQSDYRPGGKLEINPTALGIDFYESGPGKQTLAASKGINMNDFNQGDFNQKKAMIENAGLDFNMSTLEKLNQPVESGFIESFMGAAVPNKMKSIVTMPGHQKFGPVNQSEFRNFMDANIEGIAGNLTRQDLANMYENYNKFLGRPSNYLDARVKGTASNLIGMIPKFGWLQKGAEALFGPAGDRSMQSKYAVDNAGYGNTGMRDEFGLSVVDDSKRIFGKQDRNYLDRMEDQMDKNIDFFGGTRWGFGGKELDKKGSSVSLTVKDEFGNPQTMSFKEAWDNFDDLTDTEQKSLIEDMKNINSFKAKQMLAYKNRIATETINKDWKKKQAEIAEAEKQKQNLANATARQKATMAARGQEGGSGGTFVDRNTGAMKGYEKGAGGGKDAPSEHFYIKDGGIAQYAPQRKGIASMFTRRR